MIFLECVGSRASLSPLIVLKIRTVQMIHKYAPGKEPIFKVFSGVFFSAF